MLYPTELRAHSVADIRYYARLRPRGKSVVGRPEVTGIRHTRVELCSRSVSLPLPSQNRERFLDKFGCILRQLQCRFYNPDRLHLTGYHFFSFMLT
jgi:hypothetical protein